MAKIKSKPKRYIMTTPEWRMLPSAKKMELAKLICDRVVNKVKQKDISAEIQLSSKVISRIVENNGLAQKGPFKRRTPAVRAVPVCFNIDVAPNPNVLLHPENVKDFGKIAVADDDEVFDDQEKAENDTAFNNSMTEMDRSEKHRVLAKAYSDPAEFITNFASAFRLKVAELNQLYVDHFGSGIATISVDTKDGSSHTHRF